MNHTDHVYLLEGDPGVREEIGRPIRGAGGTWADIGSGEGAFTLALADLLAKDAVIHSIDRDRGSLRAQEVAMRKSFPDRNVIYTTTDFTRPLDLLALDGIVMANSLHFIPDREKPALLRRFCSLLKPGGQFILVEYNVDRGNMWVPHPLSFTTWSTLARDAGYTQTRQLGARPSRFLGQIFSAIAW